MSPVVWQEAMDPVCMKKGALRKLGVHQRLLYAKDSDGESNKKKDFKKRKVVFYASRGERNKDLRGEKCSW